MNNTLKQRLIDYRKKVIEKRDMYNKNHQHIYVPYNVIIFNELNIIINDLETLINGK